jgi:hypothetical protein
VTWYHLPPSSLPATVTADSSWPCATSGWTCEPYVVLSGTATQRPSSWNGWRKRDWIRLLSGLTLPPSTAARGAAWWTSSLQVSRANRSVQPAEATASKTNDTCGPISSGSSKRFDLDVSSLRTSPRSSRNDGSTTSSPTLPKWGSMRNGVVSVRPKSVPPIDENGSGWWPTPTGMDSMGSGSKGSHVTLTDATRRGRLWPTLQARDFKGEAQPGRQGAAALPTATRLWPTPAASMAYRGTDPDRTNDRAGSPTYKSVALAWDGPPDPTETGPTGSQRVDLNPFFVAELMGLPADWLTPSTSEVTDWCRRQQQQHSPFSPND